MVQTNHESNFPRAWIKIGVLSLHKPNRYSSQRFVIWALMHDLHAFLSEVSLQSCTTQRDEGMIEFYYSRVYFCVARPACVEAMTSKTPEHLNFPIWRILMAAAKIELHRRITQAKYKILDTKYKMYIYIYININLRNIFSKYERKIKCTMD